MSTIFRTNPRHNESSVVSTIYIAIPSILTLIYVKPDKLSLPNVLYSPYSLEETSDTKWKSKYYKNNIETETVTIFFVVFKEW